jgi:membrane-anchored glycerophosphoryl diester phosphodiesterase (GDPDase)
MKKTGFFRLFIRSLPEIWFCQVVIGAILWFPMTVLNTVFTTIATSGDFAVTTANLGTLLSPRVAEMLACNFLMVLLLLVGEICAPIFLCEAIQKQEKTGVFSILKKSIKSVPRFFTPSGLLILLYILFVSPLIGTGLYLSMTESLYIPRFITEVIDKNMTYAVLYRVVLFALGLLGFIHMFVFHGILLDGERPWDAMRRSRQHFVRHWKTILIAIIQITLVIRVLYAVQAFVFDDLPQRYLDSLSSEMPR